ncbi:hypothetical protein FA15DRAFT_620778 [Coprinopsis marcescibilis]|uniref:Uncharacterized protein n=1 Tax=Coprinopsis marcescibilis TaxID=230819 RepID=A0A5C3KS98_COPMA|nr:hypothetical protein FA15DRAFT_620778 [Coprinopsis marcescibilis]
MCLYGLSRFLETSRETRRRRLPYIVASLVIFILFTLAATIKVSQEYKTLLQVSNGLDWFTFKEKDRQRVPIEYVGMACNSLVFLIGDGLLLYRCYILMTGRRWLVAIPGLSYLGMIGTLICEVVTKFISPSSVEATSSGFTVVTNVSITASITYRLLKAQKQLKEALPSDSMRVYHGVAQILVESAVPLTLSGLGHSTVSLTVLFARPPAVFLTLEETGRLITASGIFATLYYAFMAISPQMIIFRVTTGRSWSNASESSRPESSSRPIVFAKESKDDQSFVIGTQSISGMDSPQVSQSTRLPGIRENV